MTNKHGVLLASFIKTIDEEEIQREVEFIVNNIEITNNLIFLLEDKEDPEKKIITYNAITTPGKPFNPRLFTMRMHKAVAAQHDGQIGKHLKLDWNEYENSILLTAGKELKVHPVEVSKIFKVEDGPLPDEE